MNTFAFAEPEDDVVPSEGVYTTTQTQEDGWNYGVKTYQEGPSAWQNGYNDGYYDRGYNPDPSSIPTVGFDVSDDWRIGYQEGYRSAYQDDYRDGYNQGVRDRGGDDPHPSPDQKPVHFQTGDDNPKALKVEYSSNGDKKKPVDNVVKFTNVDNPVSWNATPDGVILMETVLTGDKYHDEYLYMKNKVPVSSDFVNYGVDGLVNNKYSASYNVIPVGTDQFLFMRYSVGSMARVAGYDYEIPTTTYDGRKVDFNKSGKGKMTGSKKEALNISVALVQYSGDTVTEIPGVTVAKANVDKKNNQNASVAWDITEIKDKNGDYDHSEYPLLSGATLPTFTFTVKAAGDAKSQKKALNDALKDKVYPFAIKQLEISVEPNQSQDKKGNPAVSANDPTTLNPYFTPQFNEDVDRDYAWADDLKISKLSAKGANVTIPVYTYNGKKDGEAEVKIKAKKDFEFSTGTLAGETVLVLELKGTNVVYTNTDKDARLSGYRYAFRQSPTDSKKIRKGIFKNNDDGFVYSVD